MSHDPTLTTVHGSNPPELWRFRITAPADPLLLSRVLQKFAVPVLVVRRVSYDAGHDDIPARIDLTVEASHAWAELTAAKLRKLVAIHHVEHRRC